MIARTEVLVGREPETQLLAASLEAAAAGQPRFLLITGEAGIGKTRLLREAADRGRALGLRVLSGTAARGGATMPYLPVLAPMAECAVETNAAAGPVRRLIRGDAPFEPSDPAGAARLLDSIFAVLTQEPTLLVVDDLHWADAATVVLLDYVAHRARSESLAVVVAARDDEQEGPWSQIADARRFMPLGLQRLSRRQVAEHVESLLGRSPELDVVSVVFERSAGNPFFVEQLVAHGVDGYPTTLRRLVLHRVHELPPSTQRTVEALAVIGRAADESLVGSVVGIGDDEVEADLRRAADRGVVVAAESGFVFRHPLFPELILGELSGPTRRRLHRHVAQALEAAGAGAAETATHWWEAGDEDHAWASALAAGDAAERVFAFVEARLHLERAADMWPEHATGRSRHLLRVAEAAWLAGDAGAAFDLAQRVVLDDSPTAPNAYLALGSYAWDIGELDTATSAFDRAAELAPDNAPPGVRAQAAWGLARARTVAGRHDEARALAAESAQLAREVGDRATEARALLVTGIARCFDGDVDGVDDIERGLRLAVAARSPVAVGHGYQFAVNMARFKSGHERALELAIEGVETCERLGLARTHGSDLRGWAAGLLIDLGRWDEADDMLLAASPRAFAYLVGAVLAMRRGQLEKAAAGLGQAATSSGIAGARGIEGSLQLAEAELAWLARDAQRSAATLAGQPDAFPGVGGAAFSAQRARLLARVAADDSRRAQPPEEWRRHPLPELDAALSAEIAAERARGDGVAAPELWAACVQAWDGAARPYDAVYARLRHAEASFGSGAREAAKKSLRRAAADAEQLGARPLRALVDDLARRARVSAALPRRRDVYGDQPTPRELDVLAFLAEGLTNREIAARLFLSPKTVGIHVSRILRKLDAHTRGEAVALARRRGLLD